jgi:CubicO group peptidase (beta-lactamase class C family)
MDFSTEDWEWLGDWLERRGLPGIAIAVADEDEEVAFDSVGWAELGRRPIDQTTLFELGSIGKTFTTLLACRLLELEAPVTDYLPWFEVRSAHGPITVEHLLMHTSGLIRGADTTPDSRFDVWALRETEVGFAPGERFYYSNVGYRRSAMRSRRPWESTTVAPLAGDPRAIRLGEHRAGDHRRGARGDGGRLRPPA